MGEGEGEVRGLVWILLDIVVFVMTVNLSEATWKLEKVLFKNLPVKINGISIVFNDENRLLRDWLYGADTTFSGDVKISCD